MSDLDLEHLCIGVARHVSSPLPFSPLYLSLSLSLYLSRSLLFLSISPLLRFIGEHLHLRKQISTFASRRSNKSVAGLCVCVYVYVYVRARESVLRV